jgi:L-ribulose-5-phosphate 3-epimerase
VTTISFMSANYVAEHVGYNMTEGWGQGETATSDYFEPIETYRARLDDLLGRVVGLGFEAIDLWVAHLHPRWATEEHLSIASELLARHELTVPSIAGGFGTTPEEFESSCRVAIAVGAPLLGGMTELLDTDRKSVERLLDDHDLVLAVENHPERTPEEMLAKISNAGDRIGTTVDTGWYATHGYDAAAAIDTLGNSVLHVHLKDIREVGEHITCPYGEGIVPLPECAAALARIGYGGAYTVEHEPEDHDPTEEARSSASMLRGWLDEVVPTER